MVAWPKMPWNWSHLGRHFRKWTWIETYHQTKFSSKKESKKKKKMPKCLIPLGSSCPPVCSNRKKDYHMINNSTLGIHPQKTTKYSFKKTYAPQCSWQHYSQLARYGKELECPSADELINKMRYVCTWNGILLSHKKE